MCKLLKYKTPTPTYVKFQRIIMGWLAIAALFSENINLVWIFFILTAIGIFTGTEYSPVSIFYKLIKKIFSFDMVKISEHHIRYYQVGTSVDFIDHLLRIIASGSALLLFFFGLHMAAWAMISFLSIFMMLSAYFGFCLSALSYIFLQSLGSLKANKCNSIQPVNMKCTLAKHCFTPYKRCDSCHVDITQCLGTKFNTTVLVIGLMMPIFLFAENRYIIELNIILIMGLIFWLGYQMNYSTDDLAKSNDDNIKLNEKLRAYNDSLEAEVQKRTSEIEHLVIHDRLTNAFNRYWFEKKVNKAIVETHNNNKHYVMAFLDLDKFKIVNDTAGHLAGDELLQNITLMIKEIITDKDLFARLGGDEFAILFELENTQNINDVVATCNKICKVIDAYRFDWDGHTFQIGVSIGVVDAKKEIPNLRELFRKADKACYSAKNAGRNRVVVYSDTI